MAADRVVVPLPVCDTATVPLPSAMAVVLIVTLPVVASVRVRLPEGEDTPPVTVRFPAPPKLLPPEARRTGAAIVADATLELIVVAVRVGEVPAAIVYPVVENVRSDRKSVV